jgi:hypothetical protein
MDAEGDAEEDGGEEGEGDHWEMLQSLQLVDDLCVVLPGRQFSSKVFSWKIVGWLVAHKLRYTT